jgi:putative membrane protein
MKEKKDSFTRFLLVFKFKGYLIKRLFPNILWVMLPTAILCIVHSFWKIETSANLSLPSLLGAILGILLVFRNNTAYERWWEARKELGALVNTSRNFALQVTHLLPHDRFTGRLIKLIAAFPYALKEHLRGKVKIEEISFLSNEILERLKTWNHQPNGLTNEMTIIIKEKYNKNQITDFQLIKLLGEIEKLIDILGKCERIRRTPMPQAHTYLLKMFIVIYAIIAPFGLIETLGWWSLMAVAAMYYVAMSIVIIAEEIEDPFGTDENDLPVDAIAKNIHLNVKEIYINNLEKS